jgi:hypothetical protein
MTLDDFITTVSRVRDKPSMGSAPRSRSSGGVTRNADLAPADVSDVAMALKVLFGSRG